MLPANFLAGFSITFYLKMSLFSKESKTFIFYFRLCSLRRWLSMLLLLMPICDCCGETNCAFPFCHAPLNILGAAGAGAGADAGKLDKLDVGLIEAGAAGAGLAKDDGAFA